MSASAPAPPASSPLSLTAHLLSLPTPRPYTAATQHAFLTAAGHGTLPPSLLSLYLSQDRIYAAHAYPAFLGHLLARIPFPDSSAAPTSTLDAHGRLVRVIAGALENVVREARFFEEVAQRWGLRLEACSERKATRDYVAEMARVGAAGSLEDGWVFLWAMERVYLDAWRYVGSLTPSPTTTTNTASTAPAIAELVANWTNASFVQFVDELAEIVDGLGIEPGSRAWRRAEAVWARVVELEEAFWPGEGEVDEVVMR